MRVRPLDTPQVTVDVVVVGGAGKSRGKVHDTLHNGCALPRGMGIGGVVLVTMMICYVWGWWWWWLPVVMKAKLYRSFWW